MEGAGIIGSADRSFSEYQTAASLLAKTQELVHAKSSVLGGTLIFYVGAYIFESFYLVVS